MKNIAVLCRALNAGGAERIAGILAKELSKIYKVYFFLIETNEIVYEYGGTIIDIGSYGTHYETTIRNMKLKLQIDVSISFLETMNFVNLRTRGRERVILSERCTLETLIPKIAALDYKVQTYYNTADEIVVCASGVKYSLIHTYGIDKNIITIIYNFINKNLILEKAAEKLDESIQTFLGGTEYFISVGRLHPVKNQARLIRQFSNFHKDDKSAAKLLIVGSGEKYNELCGLIECFDLQDYVRIIPYNENPFKYVARAKALIVSSHSEGLPNVILEAMVLQCPVIATDCLSGPRELLKGTADYQQRVDQYEICRRGILVCDNSTEDNGETCFMADAMRWVGNNKNCVEEIRKNQEQYMSEYTNEQLLEQWIEVIEKEDRKEIDIYETEKRLIKTAAHVYIYGAGKVGMEVYEQIKTDFYIEAFIVTEKGAQQDFILGLPVKELDDVAENGDKSVFIIAVGEKNQDDVVNGLKKRGLDNIVFPFN